MDYERVLLVKPTVSVFMNIPSSGGGRGHRADHWDLKNPSWVGRIRIITIGPKCMIRLEDKTSGELFAECPIDNYPAANIDPVIDSSRYFVLKVVNGMDHAFVGMGFDDRSDSFDLRVTLQEHFRRLQKELDIKQEEDNPIPTIDYSLKDGQSIKIDFKGFKKTAADEVNKQDPDPTKANQAVKMSGGMLLPPPSAKKQSGPTQLAQPALKPISVPADPFLSDSKTDAKPSEDPFQSDSGGGWIKF